MNRRAAISLDSVASLSGRHVAVARATARQRAEDARAASEAISDEKKLVTLHAAQPAGLWERSRLPGYNSRVESNCPRGAPPWKACHAQLFAFASQRWRSPTRSGFRRRPGSKRHRRGAGPHRRGRQATALPPGRIPVDVLYCVHELHLSEDSAYKRTQAARTARQFPAIFDAVAKGRLHLTGVNRWPPTSLQRTRTRS